MFDWLCDTQCVKSNNITDMIHEMSRFRISILKRDPGIIENAKLKFV